jgi:predicted dehydrogenase
MNDSTSPRLRLALVGCGKMGLQHARAIRRFGGVDLVACVDPDERALARVEPETGLRPVGYVDLGEMLARERPDVVVVATTTRWHSQLAVQALEAGVHVMSEKPMASSLELADDMIRASVRTGKALLINNEYNVHPRTRAAIEAVAAGRIGTLVSMSGRFKGNFAGGFDLAEGAPHLFSLAEIFAGSPIAVSARFATDARLSTATDVFSGALLNTLDGGWLVGDRASVNVEFSGAVFLHAEFLGRKTTPSILLTGTEGAIFLPYGATVRPPLICDDPTDPLTLWQPLDVEYPRFAENIAPTSSDPDDVYSVLNERANAIAYADWTSWLSDGAVGRHPMSAEQGRNAMEIIHGSYRSHFEHGGGWVQLPLSERTHKLEELALARA